jgi:hypothetical protein
MDPKASLAEIIFWEKYLACMSPVLQTGENLVSKFRRQESVTLLCAWLLLKERLDF